MNVQPTISFYKEEKLIFFGLERLPEPQQENPDKGNETASGEKKESREGKKGAQEISDKAAVVIRDKDRNITAQYEEVKGKDGKTVCYQEIKSPNSLPNLRRLFHRDELDRYYKGMTIEFTGKKIDWKTVKNLEAFRDFPDNMREQFKTNAGDTVFVNRAEGRVAFLSIQGGEYDIWSGGRVIGTGSKDMKGVENFMRERGWKGWEKYTLTEKDVEAIRGQGEK